MFRGCHCPQPLGRGSCCLEPAFSRCALIGVPAECTKPLIGQTGARGPGAPALRLRGPRSINPTGAGLGPLLHTAARNTQLHLGAAYALALPWGLLLTCPALGDTGKCSSSFQTPGGLAPGLTQLWACPRL